MYKQIKRHGPIKKAIMQMISMRVSGFVAMQELHIRNGKTSTVDGFPRVVV